MTVCITFYAQYLIICFKFIYEVTSYVVHYALFLSQNLTFMLQLYCKCRSRAATLDATDLTTSATVGSIGAESATIPTPITTSGDTDLAMAALYSDTTTTNVTSPNDYSTNTTTNPTTTNPTTSTANPITTPHVEYDDLCTHYDLYSVVHHAGALGGGHYATTCRALNMNIGSEQGSGGGSGGSSAHNTSVTNNVNTNTYTTNTTNTVNEDQWYCYNDNIVTTIHTSEICAPSAYLLFYMRKDMRQGDVLALLRRQLSLPVVVVDESSSSGSVEAHVSSGSDGGNGGNSGVSGSGVGSGDDVDVGSEVSSSAGYSSNNSVVDEPVVDNSDNIVESAVTTTTTAGPIAETTIAEPIQTTNTVNPNTTTHTTNTDTNNTHSNTTHPRSGNNIANMGFSGFIDDSEHSSTSNSSTNNNTSGGGAGSRGSKKEEGGCIPS